MSPAFIELNSKIKELAWLNSREDQVGTGSKVHSSLLEALNKSYFTLTISTIVVALKKTTTKCWHVITGMPAYKLQYVLL